MKKKDLNQKELNKIKIKELREQNKLLKGLVKGISQVLEGKTKPLK